MNKRYNIRAEISLRKGKGSYLSPDNKRLLELQKAYSQLTIPAVDSSIWSRGYVDQEVNITEFRGDCAYVWQLRDGNQEYQHILSALYAQSIDSLGLFDLLREDDQFGVQAYNYNESHLVSRDLLDSVIEILFLERHLGISKLENINVLDIGAGYGRLAHRMVEALPNIRHMFCVEAIPESTFISEYYLNYRGVSDRAHAVPIYEIEDLLNKYKVQLATNIHSFSECTLTSINWWLDLLISHSVKYLMIEPNAGKCSGKRLLSAERDHNRIEYLGSIESRGYKLIAKEPSYMNSSVQKFGVSPTYYYLFELM